MKNAFLMYLVQLYFYLFLRGEDISVEFPSHKKIDFGSKEPKIVITIVNYNFILKVIANPYYNFASTYVDGDWFVSKGKLGDLLSIILSKITYFEHYTFIGALITRLKRLIFILTKENTIRKSKDNVHHHYDVGNDFYKLFLDNNMVYSCADYETGASSIEEAQILKVNNTIKRLDLNESEKVLEVGSGWGFLASEISKHGVKVTGITLSKEQLDLSIEKYCSSEENNTIEFLLKDYREHAQLNPKHYDRIVSIGMFEHVGYNQMHVFFTTMAAMLKEDGLILVHTILRKKPNSTNSWIEKNIFPGGYMPSEQEVLKFAKGENFGELSTSHVYKGFNYALTLQAWQTKFKENLQKLEPSKFSDKLIKTYEFYLASSEAAFREGDLYVKQFVFKRK